MGIMEKKMESTIYYNRIYILGRIGGILYGDLIIISKAIFYLLKPYFAASTYTTESLHIPFKRHSFHFWFSILWFSWTLHFKGRI